MSIAAVADLQVDSGNKRPVTGTAVINSLAAWVPTEAVAGYVAVQAILPGIHLTKGKPICDASNFDPRWILFGVMLAFTLLLCYVYYYVKARSATGKVEQKAVPLRAMLLTGLAFVLWTFALPNSPFQDFCGVETWQRTLAIVVGSGALGAIGLLWHISPAWDQAGGGGGGTR